MDVAEVIRLADWYKLNTTEVEKHYNALVNVLQNNAQQASQQPVAESLTKLSSALSEMATQELSTLQLRVLKDLQTDDLVGEQGRLWLNKQVRSTTYDPATTFQTIQQAATRISEAKRKLTEFKSAAGILGFHGTSHFEVPGNYIVNVIFQREAAINSVRDWKTSAADWELIISSVAGIVGEKAEEVKVVGASNGSLIFVLSASPFVTRVLATISKHIASIANDYLDFQLKRQELEQSRMLTQTIRDDLALQESNRRSSAKVDIIEDVRKLLPNAKPEEISKLEKGIDKYISFSERGGEVDFVLPPEVEDDSEDEVADTVEVVREVRQLIEDFHSEQQKTKLLTLSGRKREDEY